MALCLSTGLLAVGCALLSPHHSGERSFHESVALNAPALTQGFTRGPAAYTGGYDFDSYFDEAPEASATCEEFFGMLNSAKPKPDTVLAALQILKKNKPKIFNRYTLLPNSLSLHESSFQSPRALLYGGDGKMVLTFNGDPKQRSYERLEAMCFNSANSSFEFREITFPKEANDDLEDLTSQEKLQPFVVSKANSSGTHDCRQCHTTPTRPNWDTYAVWPSAYGAIDDLLFRDDVRKEMESYDNNSFSLKIAHAEIDAFKTFSKSGRYAVLEKNWTKRPNLAVGKIFSILNGERIVAELKRLGPSFEKVKKDFAQALYCPVQGVEYKQFMVSNPNGGGSGTGRTVLTAPVNPVVARIARESGGYFKAKSAKVSETFKLDTDNYYQTDPVGRAVASYYKSIGFNGDDANWVPTAEPETVVRLAHLQAIVKPLGIELQNWSLIVNGGYEFEDGSGGDRGSNFVQILDKPFLETFFPNDQKFMDLVKARRSVPDDSLKDRKEMLQQEQDICNYIKSI